MCPSEVNMTLFHTNFKYAEKFTIHCHKLYELILKSVANGNVQKWQITSAKHLNLHYKMQRQHQFDF